MSKFQAELPGSYHAGEMIGLGLPALLGARTMAACRPLHHIGQAVSTELLYKRLNSSEWPGLVGTGIPIAGVAAAGAAKIPTAVLGVQLPLKVAESVANQPAGSVAAGIVTAGSYALLSTGSFIAYDRASRAFPQSFKAVLNSGLVGNLNGGLPGLKTTEKQPFWRTHLQRAAALQGPGIGAYAIAAGVQHQTPAERTKLRNAITADNAAFMGSLAAGTTAALSLIGESNPELAHQIMETGSNTPFWIGTTLIGLPLLKTAYKAANNTPPAIATKVTLRNWRQNLSHRLPARPRLRPAAETE
jgi:hypothetical protein